MRHPGGSPLLQLLWVLAVPTKVILTAPPLVTGTPSQKLSGISGFSGTAPAENLGATNEMTDASPRQPLWFDYPDSDKKKILAIYKLIGEEHEFVGPSVFPYFLRYILIGSVVLILLFFVYQIISKLLAKRSTM